MSTIETPWTKRMQGLLRACTEFLRAMDDPVDPGYELRLRRLEAEVDQLKAVAGISQAAVMTSSAE